MFLPVHVLGLPPETKAVGVVALRIELLQALLSSRRGLEYPDLRHRVSIRVGTQ